jgi:peptidoglycan/LPS O-acetylase OafA/YrhL
MAAGVLAGASDANESTEPGERESSAAYRPHLDGLRAVAVYLVVLFHAGSDRFPGGYIGVDVFFVLSGYLVTQLLLRDVARSGSIGFGRFYSRRFRRLLPAAFVALIVTAVVYSAIAAPVAVSNAESSFKAAFLYSTN